MLGTALLNRYRIDSELGRGGMGVVYRGYDTLLNRAVAIKVLNAGGLGTAGQARLLAEARAAAQLNHPNIVAVYDAGEAGDQPFIVMELVEGPSLREHTLGGLGETLALVRQVLAALDHAHRSGIIHRDLKLENVLLAPARVAKLTDFGLARSTHGPRLTEGGMVFGTVTYLAPELIQGEAATARSDLYALGVMLYELLAGRPPFDGADFVTIIAQHLHSPVVPPRTHNDSLPQWLDELVVRLLSKQPADRPGSAQEVLSILDQWTNTPTEVYLRVPPSPPSNLPTALTRFIGRRRELERLQRAFSPDDETSGARLVSLTGAGGVGKTRLALEAATSLLPHFSNGVWLVELAPVTDPERVPQRVAEALGVREDKDHSVQAALTGHLREKDVLLVLDNCEHLIEACARLAEELLHTCPRLRLLATSREALGIEGETTVRVPSLSLPKDQAALAESEAVQLFVDRAAAALPGFALTEANAPAIAQICRRLDGIALALELAAARVMLLSVEQIATRLDDAFRLLTGGSRTALPRQQTLRATMDWSYHLLAEPERVLLWRLSVFAGGWTLEAAEQVCMDGEPQTADRRLPSSVVGQLDVLDLLTQLVNKSLVVVEREPGAEMRYMLLETIRQYAREKLREAGEVEIAAVRGQHLRYFVRLAAQSDVALMGPQPAPWLRRLEAEAGNLRAAFEWALDSEPESALQLAAALGRFWAVHAHWSLGVDWLEVALSRAPHSPLRAPALVKQAALMVQQYNYRRAEPRLAEALTLARASGDVHTEAFALVIQAEITAWSYSQYAEAQRLNEVSLALFRSLGASGRWGAALALKRLSEVLNHQDQRAQGLARMEESYALQKEIGDVLGMAESLAILGLMARERGDNRRALELVGESLSLRRQLGDRRGLISLLVPLGFWFQTDYDRARPWLEEALALAREFGEKQGLTHSLRNLALVEYLHGNDERALALWEESRAVALELKDKLGIAYSQADLGRVLITRGEYVRATELLQESAALTREMGDVVWAAYPVSRLGFVALRQEEAEQAAACFAEALELYQRWRVPWGIAECLNGFAALSALAGHLKRAARLFGAATRIRHETDSPQPPTERADVERRIAGVRHLLGDEAFNAAWAAGQALTVEEATTEALATPPPA